MRPVSVPVTLAPLSPAFGVVPDREEAVLKYLLNKRSMRKITMIT